ncbi:hypothetical protein C7E12_18425, partial [Stenotrophomonas maltophilia]
ATWVITSFAVSTAIALPLTGWLSRRFGVTQTVRLGDPAFVITSLLCGLAQQHGHAVCRVRCRARGWPIVPITQSLLVSIYPREKRPGSSLRSRSARPSRCR